MPTGNGWWSLPCSPDNIKAVRLGVASHNLLDLAYAYLVAQANGVMEYFTFEMIEGMANHVRRTIQETGQELIVYVPGGRQRPVPECHRLPDSTAG